MFRFISAALLVGGLMTADADATFRSSRVVRVERGRFFDRGTRVEINVNRGRRGDVFIDRFRSSRARRVFIERDPIIIERGRTVLFETAPRVIERVREIERVADDDLPRAGSNRFGEDRATSELDDLTEENNETLDAVQRYLESLKRSTTIAP